MESAFLVFVTPPTLYTGIRLMLYTRVLNNAALFVVQSNANSCLVVGLIESLHYVRTLDNLTVKL